MLNPAAFKSHAPNLDISHAHSHGNFVFLLMVKVYPALQRFDFQYASPRPATRHPSVIPVGPAEGMDMFVS